MLSISVKHRGILRNYHICRHVTEEGLYFPATPTVMKGVLPVIFALLPVLLIALPFSQQIMRMAEDIRGFSE
jgi:hypothetical protein